MIDMPEGEEEEQEIEKLIWKSNVRKLWFGDGNKHTSPGGTESQTGRMPKGSHQDTS